MTVTVCPVKCWPCIHGHHEGGQHDVPDMCSNTAPPVLCGCPCTTDPTIPTVWPEMEPPDLDDISLTDNPCPLCGEVGACDYDMYGRPLPSTRSRRTTHDRHLPSPHGLQDPRRD